MRAWPILAMAVLACTASSEPKDDRVSADGPSYRAARIHQLAFAGVRLGMTFAEACRTLIGQGYARRSADVTPTCDTRHISDENFDDYFGQGDTSKETAAASVRFVTLHYLADGDPPTVDQISVYTDEPDSEAALGERVTGEWGVPTSDAKWGYRVMTYAASADQADFYHRSDFRSCQVWNGCGTPLTAAKCRRILQRYATPYATQTIYEWGRTITIEDGRRWVRHAVRSGELAAQFAGTTVRACAVPSVH